MSVAEAEMQSIFLGSVLNMLLVLSGDIPLQTCWEDTSYTDLYSIAKNCVLRLLYLHVAESTGSSLTEQYLKYYVHITDRGPFKAFSYTWADTSTS